MAQKLILKNVRAAFTNTLFVAEDFQGDGKFKFGCTLIIDPADKQVIEINKAIEAACLEKFGAKAPLILKTMRATEKACLRDGDLKAYSGFPGNLYIAATNVMRPTVLNDDKTPLVAADGKPYGGCIINASVEFWAYSTGNNGISCTLLGVQFVKDGEKFGSGSSVADTDDFDDVSAGADADSLA